MCGVLPEDLQGFFPHVAIHIWTSRRTRARLTAGWRSDVSTCYRHASYSSASLCSVSTILNGSIGAIVNTLFAAVASEQNIREVQTHSTEYLRLGA